MRRIIFLLMFILCIGLASAQTGVVLTQTHSQNGNMWEITLTGDVAPQVVWEQSPNGGQCLSGSGENAWQVQWQFFYGTNGADPTIHIPSCNTWSSFFQSTTQTCSFSQPFTTLDNPITVKARTQYFADGVSTGNCGPNGEQLKDGPILSFDLCSGAGCASNCRADSDCTGGEMCEGYTTTTNGECWVSVSIWGIIQSNTQLLPLQSCNDDSDCPADSSQQVCGTGLIPICTQELSNHYCNQIPSETLGTCTPPTAGVTCPDQVCDANEGCSNCPQDCGCTDPNNPFCDDSSVSEGVCGPCPVGETCDRRSIDDINTGFCTNAGECFYDATTGCVSDGYYDVNDVNNEDKYCYSGEWSTRTRLVAEKLLDIAQSQSNDFKIFCDEKQSSLIFGDPDQPTGQHENYCTLMLLDSSGNPIDVVIGAAVYDIDNYLADLENAFAFANGLNANNLDFESHSCDSTAVDFAECLTETSDTDSNKHLHVYYDANKQLVLMTPSSTAVTGTWIDQVVTFFQNILGTNAETARLTDFDRLYIDNQGNQEVVAIYQSIYDDAARNYVDYLTVEYNSNVLVNYNELMNTIPSQSVARSGNILIYTNPDSTAWTLLSGRTRI